MAKNKITDLSSTANDNTDLGNIGVQGTNNVSNFDNALRYLSKMLADVDRGVYPVRDTWGFGDPVDLTKIARLDAGSITTGNTRVITAADRDINMAKLVSGEYAMSLSDAEKAQALANAGFEMSGGATGDIYRRNANSVMAKLALGTARQLLGVNAAGNDIAYADKVTVGTPVTTTSGTTVPFTSLAPTARIHLLCFAGFSTSGTQPPRIQLGDSGGYENSGYGGSNSDIVAASAVAGANFTDAFGIGVNTSNWAAAATLHGVIAIVCMDPAANTWAAFGVTSLSSSVVTYLTSGSKSLSATLDRIQVIMDGSQTADAGVVNLLSI